MTLRISTAQTNRQTLHDLQRSQERFALLSRQISTGQKATTPSGDPSSAGLLVNFQDSIDRNAAYTKQIDYANSLLQGTSDGLAAVNNQLTRLLELGQQGCSDTLGAAGRANMVPEVDGIRSDLISLGNTQAEGKYLFAGTRTTTQPFTDNATKDGVAYAGNESLINHTVGPSATVDSNIPGSTAFYGPGGQGSSTDVFKAAADLRNGLKNNDTALIKTAYANLQTIQARLTQTASEVGSRQSQIASLKENLESANAGLQSVQATFQSVDYPTALSQYSSEQVAQSATMKVMAKLNSQNLFDFIG